MTQVRILAKITALRCDAVGSPLARQPAMTTVGRFTIWVALAVLAIIVL
jgi:hypothetical protein